MVKDLLRNIFLFILPAITIWINERSVQHAENGGILVRNSTLGSRIYLSRG